MSARARDLSAAESRDFRGNYFPHDFSYITISRNSAISLDLTPAEIKYAHFFFFLRPAIVYIPAMVHAGGPPSLISAV